MGRRARRRQRTAAAGEAAAPPVSATSYTSPDGAVLTLRDRLSPGTLDRYAALERSPAASADDLWQRRHEFLFERLAVRWEIAGLPLERQDELLGRYRMAGADERRWVRDTVAAHARERMPELGL